MRSRRLWLGLAVSLLFLGLLLVRVNLGEAMKSLAEANYLYLVPAVGLYALAVAFRTLRWRFLLFHLKHISARRLLPVVVVGYMANNLLPVRLGEVVRSYYLGQREGVSKSAALGTIVLERVFDGLTLLFFLAAAALVLPVGGLVQELGREAGVPAYLLISAATVPFAGAIGLLLAFAYRPAWPVSVVRSFSHRLPGKLGSRLEEVVGLFVSGLASLRTPRRLLALSLLSLPVWLLEASMYYVIGFSFDLQGSFSSPAMMAVAILATTATSNLATSLPSSQGGIGPFEFFAAGTLVALGIAGSVATAYTVALHAALLIPVTLAGLGILWGQNLSLAKLTRMGKADEEKEGEYAAPEASMMEKEPW